MDEACCRGQAPGTPRKPGPSAVPGAASLSACAPVPQPPAGPGPGHGPPQPPQQLLEPALHCHREDLYHVAYSHPGTYQITKQVILSVCVGLFWFKAQMSPQMFCPNLCNIQIAFAENRNLTQENPLSVLLCC